MNNLDCGDYRPKINFSAENSTPEYSVKIDMQYNTWKNDEQCLIELLLLHEQKKNDVLKNESRTETK